MQREDPSVDSLGVVEATEVVEGPREAAAHGVVVLVESERGPRLSFCILEAVEGDEWREDSLSGLDCFRGSLDGLTIGADRLLIASGEVEKPRASHQEEVVRFGLLGQLVQSRERRCVLASRLEVIRALPAIMLTRPNIAPALRMRLLST